MIRFPIAFLMLCSVSSVACGQVKIEVRQMLTGIDGVETVAGKTFVSATSKPVVESVGFIDLGTIPDSPQVLKVSVTDSQRRPVATERISNSQWVIRGEGRVWIDARVTHLPTFLLDESAELELPAKLPEPKPEPIPTDETERIVSNAILELRKGYGQAFRSAAGAIERREITVDAKLQSYLEPLTRTARTNAMAGVDGFIDAKIPRNVDKLKPEAAKFLENIGLAFEKGTK